MNKSFKSLIAVAALAFAAAASAAAPAASVLDNTYVQGSVGFGNVSIPQEDGYSRDKTSGGGKAIVGYKFNENFSAEAGYLVIGKATAKEPGLSVSAQGQGFTLGVAGFVPVTKELSLVGRTGAYFTKTDVKAKYHGFGVERAAENNIVPYVGFGVEYALDKNLSLTGGVDFAQVKFGGESFNGRLVSVGLGYKF